jgi:hypothetical protein
LETSKTLVLLCVVPTLFAGLGRHGQADAEAVPPPRPERKREESPAFFFEIDDSRAIQPGLSSLLDVVSYHLVFPDLCLYGRSVDHAATPLAIVTGLVIARPEGTIRDSSKQLLRPLAGGPIRVHKQERASGIAGEYCATVQ